MSGTNDKLSDPICIKRSVKISGTLRIKRYKVYKDKCNIVNVVLNIHRNHKAYYGRGEGGKGVWRWGEREIIYLSLHCHHQNYFCIKMGRDGSHFNVSLIVRYKVTRQCPQTTTFLKRRESRSGFEPRSLCLPA